MESAAVQEGIDELLKTGKITDEIRREIKETFELFDFNHDGTISTSELEKVFVSLGMIPSKQELHNIICRLDVDGNGSIEFSEFENFVTTSGFLKYLPDDTDTSAMDAFKLLDVDGDGYITVEELKSFLSQLDGKKHDEEAEELLRNADTNKDRKIDYTEFKSMAWSV